MIQKSELADLYTSRVQKLEIFANIARDTDLQIEAQKGLILLAEDILEIKSEAIRVANEDIANMCLGCQCAIASLISEIAMWVLLKQNQPDKAWDELIEAQNSAAAAIRADPGFAHLIERCNYLLAIERLVFPPQVFSSAGLTIGGLTCMICGMEYGECGHIAGRPYMGRFCSAEVKGPIVPDHVAIVDDPEDKRCRVTTFGVEGGHRNRMTWVVTPTEDGEDRTGQAEMIILRAN